MSKQFEDYGNWVIACQKELTELFRLHFKKFNHNVKTMDKFSIDIGEVVVLNDETNQMEKVLFNQENWDKFVRRYFTKKVTAPSKIKWTKYIKY